MTELPTPDRRSASEWAETHLGDLAEDGRSAAVLPARVGGQRAADEALRSLDIRGYAEQRSQVWPPSARGASVLSPYVRHGLLTLREVIDAVVDAPAGDRRRFVDELWWQEYTRHLYARVGASGVGPTRRHPAVGDPSWPEPMPDSMECMRQVRRELEDTGWLVNQTRMWVASQWTVRAGQDWESGEDWMFRHLLDGSRAANRYGWLWSVGAMTSKPYGFSRWQVERRAPEWCESCTLASACPIDGWPTAVSGPALDDRSLRAGPDLVGPDQPSVAGSPSAVWLTAESIGRRDGALRAWPDLPVVFVFDAQLLRRLRLSLKRLVFLAECLADLAETRDVVVRRGDPVEELAGERLASTFAPVPGYVQRAERLDVVAQYPYPWLSRPSGGDVRSHSAWITQHRHGK